VRGGILGESHGLATCCVAGEALITEYAPPMDYDATDIAAAYDLGRSHGPAVLELWMRAIGAHVAAPKGILDLGCGTGRFSNALAAHFDTEVIAVDPSTKMLEQAREKPTDRRVRYESGRGEAIPLADASVDLVFISMSFHHVSDPPLVGRECRRVLRHGGCVFLRGGTSEQIASYPYVPFIPATLPLLERVLTPASFVRGVFEAAGFQTLSTELVWQEVAPSFQAYADKLATRADSIIAALAPADFEAGMAALRAHGARNPGLAVTEPIDVFVFGAVARRVL
jgi:ubiquinone/menaquinone biosynthesis C-methylase UbiE